MSKGKGHLIDRILDIVLATKSGALTSVLIVAGALVSVSAGAGLPTTHVSGPPPSPSLEAVPPLALDLENEMDEDEIAPPEDEDEPEDAAVEEKPKSSHLESTCQNAAAARADARARVRAALTRFGAVLEELRAQHRSARALEMLDKAEAMLREIAGKADAVLAETHACDASHVAERAIDAMETVVNLAKSAAAETPTPKATERPKVTAKPTTPKPTARPSRTPSCDDRLYENKLKMAAAFEKYHTLNDKLYYAIKRTASAATVATVLANDKLMHTTYDQAKQRILGAGCAGDLGAAAATRAAATFERAWLSSAAAAAGDRR